jgi:hypothetical protein
MLRLKREQSSFDSTLGYPGEGHAAQTALMPLTKGPRRKKTVKRTTTVMKDTKQNRTPRTRAADNIVTSRNRPPPPTNRQLAARAGWGYGGTQFQVAPLKGGDPASISKVNACAYVNQLKHPFEVGGNRLPSTIGTGSVVF